MADFWKHFWNTLFENHWNCYEIFKNTLKHINFENTFKHIVWKPLKPMGSFENILKHYLKTLWNTFLKHKIWKPLKPMRTFENTLKHTTWKALKPMRTFEKTLKYIIWKHFETYEIFEKHFETYFENIQFENHWNLWGILKTLWNTLLKHCETHNLKIIETYGKFLKTLLKHIIWKPLKPMGNFQNILKHYLKTLWNTLFENHWNLWGVLQLWTPLKHIIWKHFENYGEFLKNHSETHYLKTIEIYEEFCNFEHHWNTSFENTLKTMGNFKKKPL